MAPARPGCATASTRRHSSRRRKADGRANDARGTRHRYQPPMSRLGNPFALLPVEAELLKERASSLRVTGEKLEEALAELRGIAERVPQLSPPDLAMEQEAHTRLFREAERLRWNMIVQRE